MESGDAIGRLVSTFVGSLLGFTLLTIFVRLLWKLIQKGGEQIDKIEDRLNEKKNEKN